MNLWKQKQLYVRQPVFNAKKAIEQFHKRLNQGYWLVSIMTLLLTLQLINLQIIQHKTYTTLSEHNQIRLIPLPSERGLITDRHGIILAENAPNYTLEITPDRIPHLHQTLQALQKIIHLSPKAIAAFKRRQQAYYPFTSIPLKYHLSESEMARFHVNQHQFPGVSIKVRQSRYYPKGALMLNPVGYLGHIHPNTLSELTPNRYAKTDYLGKSGIEKYYEALLHGSVGYQKAEINASGHIVRILEKHPPIKGKNITLTIDTHLQSAAQHAFGNYQGSAVAINPNNGEVLLLFSNPSFNPNRLTRDLRPSTFNQLNQSHQQSLFNLATQGQFSPASTIKPFLALQGLEQGHITPTTSLYDPGWYRIPHTHHIYHDFEAHGWVNLHKAIQVSCDTYFYHLALKLGIKKIGSILKRFQFGRRTGIDLPTEASGLVPSPAWKHQLHQKPWYIGDTVVVGIGQGYLLVTPLQLAVATAILAKHGLWFRPHLLLEQKKVASRIPIKLQHPQHWDTIIQAMQAVIRSPEGTGRHFGRNTAYTVAGKTGTAQLHHLKHHHLFSPHATTPSLRDNSLFIAFAPIQHPTIALAVIVQHTPDAAPKIARAIMDAYFSQIHEPNT